MFWIKSHCNAICDCCSPSAWLWILRYLIFVTFLHMRRIISVTYGRIRLHRSKIYPWTSSLHIKLHQHNQIHVYVCFRTFGCFIPIFWMNSWHFVFSWKVNMEIIVKYKDLMPVLHDIVPKFICIPIKEQPFYLWCA